jgi:hypothetical protein
MPSRDNAIVKGCSESALNDGQFLEGLLDPLEKSESVVGGKRFEGACRVAEEE